MAAKLEGDGDFAWEVKGESKHFDVLSPIWRKAGGSKEEQIVEVEAELVPEPKNPADRNAVAVLIGGKKVGYLNRREAATYATVMKGQRATCPAQITSFTGDIFSVSLDLPDDWEPADDEVDVPVAAAPRKRPLWLTILIALVLLCAALFLLSVMVGVVQGIIEAINPTGAVFAFLA